MKDNNKKPYDRIRWLLNILMTQVIICLFLGEFLYARDNKVNQEKTKIFDREWIVTGENGIKTNITLPGKCEAQEGEWVSIETKLPDDQEDTWCYIRSSFQDYRIYVDDELRTEYSTKGISLLGKNSASAFVFFELYHTDAGKTLRLEHTSISDYAGYFHQVYTGERTDLIHDLIQSYGFVTFFPVFMLLMGILVIIYGIVTRYHYKKETEIVYVGIAVCIVSLWLFMESGIRQFFITNYAMAANIAYYMLILMPMPIMAYMNFAQKKRYEKGYTVINYAILINFIFATIMQYAGVWDFFETKWISDVIIVLTGIYCIVTVLMDYKTGYINTYKDVAFGMFGLFVFGVIEIKLSYNYNDRDIGIALNIGLLWFVVNAVIKTGRDILLGEQEKESAIISNKAKTRFLTDMSYEIRTPINSIIGMNEMIQRESKEENTLAYAANIQNASKRLLRLMNDVLDFSKMESGKFEISEGEYNLATLLNDTIQLNLPKTRAKDIDFKLNINKNLPSVLYGDGIRIGQIINNLLSNAIKYTQKGYVEFNVDGFYNKEQFYLQIKVKDTGSGIKKRDMKVLFDAFRGFEEEKNYYVEGTGLGLSITKQLLVQMKGTIKVESDYGIGSSFSVIIPQGVVDKVQVGDLQKKYEDIAIQSVPVEQIYAPNMRILAVDDSEMDRDVIRELLKRTGVAIELASSGKECLTLCKHKKYDLILMDQIMPEMDGVETLHALKADENTRNKNTRVVAITANTTAGVSDKFLREGFDGYLPKPIMPDKLERLLARCLVEDKQEHSEEKGLNETMDNNILDRDNELYKIDKEWGIRYCGDEEMYNEMQMLYCEQSVQYLKDLKTLAEEKNWIEYATIAHAIKSTSLSLGYNNFAELAKGHEFAAKDKDELFIHNGLEDFLHSYETFVKIIKEQF